MTANTSSKVMQQQRYGNRSFVKMYRDINALRNAIRKEGTDAIQDAWDRCEPFIDAALAPSETIDAALNGTKGRTK